MDGDDTGSGSTSTADGTAGSDDLPGDTGQGSDGIGHASGTGATSSGGVLTGFWPGAREDDQGCACTTGSRGGAGWWLLFVGVGRHRRIRRAPSSAIET